MRRTVFSFFCGALASGLSLLFTPPFFRSSPTPLEASVAQLIYEDLHQYQNEVDFRTVLSLVKDLAKHRVPLKGEKELYEPIMDRAERKAEQDALAARQKAEDFLQMLQQRNPSAISVVPDRIYVEILQEGQGEAISAEDVVVVQFKEYALDGSILKDTFDQSYAIPLFQTIKGFQLGMQGGKVGERRKIYIHPDFGFGKMGRKTPNQLLIYEVAIVEKRSH